MHSVAKPRLSKGSTPRRDRAIDDKAAEGEKFTEEVQRPHLSESLRNCKHLSFAKIPRIMFTIIKYYFLKNNISARLFFIYYSSNGKNNTENTEAKVRETVFFY